MRHTYAYRARDVARALLQTLRPLITIDTENRVDFRLQQLADLMVYWLTIYR